MMPRLQKSFSVQPGKHMDLNKYSSITKVNHECRERGFQVFISGANKERLKIRDIQQEALQAKKLQINTKVTTKRKLKPTYNTFSRRKFWEKSSEIKIKGSDGSKFALQKQKPTKQATSPYGSMLHDISGKIEFHQNTRKNSQLDTIRNRYKAYFHIDGYGFCCSKQTTEPSTPAKYRIDGASPIFNQNSSKYLRHILNKRSCHSSPIEPCDNEEQKNQYYNLLDRNHERVDKLREFLTPDYEYFQSTKDSTILDFHKRDAYEVDCTDSCNGIIYDVFYHKDHHIDTSTKAPLLADDENENGSESNDGNTKDESNMYFRNEPYSEASLQSSDINTYDNHYDKENLLYEDERALVLLEDGSVSSDNGSEEREDLPPLGKALSPTCKLEKPSYNHERKESYIAQEYQCLSNYNKYSSNNSISKIDLALENVDNCKRNTLKLNLRYLQQSSDFKIPEKSTQDLVQSNVEDETLICFDNDESIQRQQCSTTTSCIPKNFSISPTSMNGLEKIDLGLLLEDVTPSLSAVDYDLVKNKDRKNKVSICQDRDEQLTKGGEFLSDRVKKLDIKKQIYLSHILDKLEDAKVTRSVDLNFYQQNPQLKNNLQI